jgi:tetratricopeptide (TPR) repeat protein
MKSLSMKASVRLLQAVCLGMISLAVCAAAQSAPDYDALVQQGKAQLQVGNKDAALNSANAAIKANADRWEAYAVAGGAMMNLKRYEEAADEFSHAIDHAPAAKQEGLRDLRKQCLLLEAGSPSISSPSQAVGGTPNSASAPPAGGPSFDETAKWIQGHMADSGFPAETTTSKVGILTRFDDTPYSVHFDGCMIQLSLAEHFHQTDTIPLNSGALPDTDAYMNIKFNLPLEKLISAQYHMLSPQDWELSAIHDSYMGRALPSINIMLSDTDAGTYSYKWNPGLEGQDNIVWNNKPIVDGAFTLSALALGTYGPRQKFNAIVISYARPGVEDSPQRMAKALQHLIEMCKQNPNQGTKDLF